MRKVSFYLLIGIALLAFIYSKKAVLLQSTPDSNDTLIASKKNIEKDSSDNQKQTGADKVIGIYEYTYPDNESLNENHYIVIEKDSVGYKGRYYGTSDEFDTDREGYLPGYFVADMKDLKITETEIRFKLNVPNENILTKQVDLKIKSFDEAIKNGYKNWDNDITLEPKNYIGEIKPNGQIFFKGEYDDSMNKTFIKQK